MIKSPRGPNLGRALRTPHLISLLAAQNRKHNNRDRNKGELAHGLMLARPSLPPLTIGVVVVYLETLAVPFVLLLPLRRPPLVMPGTVIGLPHLRHTRQGKPCQTNRRHSFRQSRRIGTKRHPGHPRPCRKVRDTALSVCIDN